MIIYITLHFIFLCLRLFLFCLFVFGLFICFVYFFWFDLFIYPNNNYYNYQLLLLTYNKRSLSNFSITSRGSVAGKVTTKCMINEPILSPRLIPKLGIVFL